MRKGIPGGGTSSGQSLGQEECDALEKVCMEQVLISTGLTEFTAFSVTPEFESKSLGCELSALILF